MFLQLVRFIVNIFEHFNYFWCLHNTRILSTNNHYNTVMDLNHLTTWFIFLKDDQGGFLYRSSQIISNALEVTKSELEGKLKFLLYIGRCFC